MNKSQDKRIQSYFISQENKQEDICRRCGACCGAYDGDPCVHLKMDKQGKFYCGIYEKRLGKRKTVSGEVFECVSIWDIIRDSWPGDYRCAYKKKYKNRV
jgi:hypothetical protein